MPREQGFTLIEVLVATAILAASLAALFPALTGALHQMRAAEDRETALLVARSVLAAVEADPADAPRQGLSGKMRWSVGLAPEGSIAQNLAAYRATITVQPEGGAAVTLETIVLGPR